MFRRFLAVLSAMLLVSAVLVPVVHAAPQRPRPVVFVHGSSGSGGQFETQARRLAGHGYPVSFIEAHEYDSTFATTTPAQVYAALDQRIARLLAATGADRVDLIAHSLGTALMQSYLRGSPARAATVAHYVNLDGATSPDLPGGVPTLAVWGEGPAERRIGGAENVYFAGQSHTQTVTSRETFSEVHEFFTGQQPRTTAIIPQREVSLSGRAVLFPSNAGAEGARLEIYQVDPRTGARTTRRPAATYPIGPDGQWGPFQGRGDAHYEFALVWSPTSVHHLYFQPFRRSDALVRLLSGRPGEGPAARMETGENHTNLVVNRQKEWWGDQGAAGDSLRVNGREILNAANAPRTKRVIGMFAYDAGRDGTTDLTAPIPDFFALPFLTGMDVFVPAGRHPVSLVSRQREGAGHADVLTVPAFPSNEHRISVQFDDYIG